MQAPSTALLRVFLRPSIRSPCINCQRRLNSNFMPRSKYAKLTRLDKLHRQQKADIRQEKKDSILRAQVLEATLTAAKAETASQLTSCHVKDAELPFRIQRTVKNNLPVYETTKTGGSKHITQVRKLTGNLDALQKELRAVLQLPDYITDKKGRKKDTVAINRTTRHIIVKGWRGPEIKKWAEMAGF